MAEVLGGAEFIVRAVPKDFDKVLGEIFKAEKKINDVKKAGLQKTSGGQQIFKTEIDNLEKLRTKAGQSAESVKKATEQITSSFNAAGSSTGASTGKISAAFEQLAARGGTLGKFASSLGGIFGKAESVLAGFGLSVSNVSILLGAGFAGGVAGLIQVGLKLIGLIPEITKAIIALGQLGGALTHLQRQIDDTFGRGSVAVTKFAQDFGHSLGLSEQAALTFIGRMGQLFQAQGETETASAEMAEGLLVAASVFRETTIGAGTFDEALRAVQNTVAGNIEGLREYNVLITEQDLRQQALSRGINVATSALDAQTRQHLAALEVIEQAQDRLANMTEAEKSLASQSEKLSSTFKDIKLVIGQAFGAALGAVVKAITPFFEAIRAGFFQLREAVTQSENFRKVLGVLLGFLTSGFRNGMKIVSAVISGFVDVLSATIKTIDLILTPVRAAIDAIEGVVNTVVGALRALGLLGDAEDETARKTKELAEAENELEKSAKETALAHEQTRENLQRLVDGYDDLETAIKEAARAELDAEENLRRVQEANVRKIQDAQRDLAEAYRDRNRAIADANERLSDIEVQNTRSLFDARRKLGEAQLQGQRSIKDAERKLHDTRLDSLKKVKDAERDLAEARKKQSTELLDAQITIEQAQLRGDAFAENRARIERSRATRDEEVKNAERKLNEAKVESAKKVADAERDLAEKRIDAAQKVRDAEIILERAHEDALERLSDAKREQARAFEDANEQIADARRRLHAVEIETSQAEFDAQRRLIDVREEGNEKIREAKKHVEELNREFATTIEEALVLLQFLEAIEENLERQAARGHTGSFRGHGATGEFQHGGLAPAGRLALVGEKGPELLIPNSDSTIVSNQQLIAMLKKLFEGGSSAHPTQVIPSINVFEVANDPEATAFAVAARLTRGVNN